MSELTPDLASEVVAACQAKAAEAGAALSRALDSKLTLAVGELSSYVADELPAGFDGPGLAILFRVGEAGLAVLLPEADGVLPDGYADADDTAAEKLETLAQELSLQLLPEGVAIEASSAARVQRLDEALSAAAAAENGALLPLAVEGGSQQAQLTLVWPLASPEKLLSADDPRSGSESNTPAGHDSQGTGQQLDYSKLPEYARSLLKIQVPVSVVLASRKETVSEVIELTPGTIVKFDKACDEMLHLYVGGCQIAEGEAVKIGDKFGFRVGAMVMPEERFKKIRHQQAS